MERVTVGFGTTLNLGNFNSLRLDLSLEAFMEPGEEWHEVAEHLHEEAKREVKRQATACRRLGEEEAA